jgi:hypothetical protein
MREIPKYVRASLLAVSLRKADIVAQQVTVRLRKVGFEV